LNKHQEREALRFLATRKKEAQTILGKIAPVLTSLEAVVAGAEFGMLSVQLREPLEIKKIFLEETVAAANIIVGSEAGEDLPKIAPLVEISEALAIAKKIVARITNVLAAIARLSH
jgi:hypothetical protein